MGLLLLIVSLYLPGTLGQADLDILAAPYFGGEFAVLFSHTAAKLIGTVELTAAGVGTYTDNPATNISDGGADLQIVATTPIRSPGGEFSGRFDTSSSGAGSFGDFSFAPPGWVADQSHHFERGIATDIIEEFGAAIISIESNSPVISNGAANMKLDIYELPPLNSYVLIGCTSDINFNDRGRAAKGIDCGMETDAFVKRGKSNPGELSIGSKFKGFAQGLSRFSGDKVTAMLIGVKEGQVTGDRLVFTNYVPTIETRLPDGEGEAMADSKGKFQELLMFPAPYA
jgi:hypothetical protein